MSNVNRLLDIFRQEVGYLEKSRAAYDYDPSIIYDKTKGAGTDNITKYAKEMDDLNVYNTPKNGYPWCKVFIDWCFVQAFGLDKAAELLKGWTAGVEQFFNWYRANEQIFNHPQVGDLVIFGECDHIGIIAAFDDDTIYTIEGNTSGATGLVANGGGVAEKSYSRYSSYIQCYARPNYSDEPSPEPPTPPTPPQPGHRTLYVGCQGSDVEYVQEKLIEKGYSLPNYGVDGDYGTETKEAVIELQKDAFPNEPKEWDGIVGNKTWAIIESPFIRPTSDYPLGLYQVNTPSGLNVRTSPVDGDIIKAYPNGTRFDTYEMQNNWARTPSGWVCLDYCKLIREY